VPAQTSPIRRGATLHPSILDTVAVVGLGPDALLKPPPGLARAVGAVGGVGAASGLSLALAFAATGFGVIGIDPDPAIVEAVRAGRVELAPADAGRLARLRESPRLGFGTEPRALTETETVVLRAGDLLAAEAVGAHVRAGQLALVASVAADGGTATRGTVEAVGAALAARGLVAGADVHLCAFVRDAAGTGGTLHGRTEHCVARAARVLRRVAPEAHGAQGGHRADGARRAGAVRSAPASAG
jgi:hypothetical protein